MAVRYGPLHKASDLIERTIPNRPTSPDDLSLVKQFIKFLKALDSAQRENPSITLTLKTEGSVNVYYRVSQLCTFHPHRNHIRLGIRIEPLTEERENLIRKLDDHPSLFRSDAKGIIFPQWRCGGGELSFIIEYLHDLPVDGPCDLPEGTIHPRSFPGEVRQQALEEFERSGRFCPGVGRARHKVNPDIERIEFDHVLPFSRGGPSSIGNVQVLCQECNRQKRDTAR